MDKAPNTSKSSFLITISRRLDAAAGMISTVFLALALMGALFSLFCWIIPNSHEMSDIERELGRKGSEAETLRNDAQQLLDEIGLADDPYCVERIAVEQYNYQRVPREQWEASTPQRTSN